MSEETKKKQEARWPGVVLSILVPWMGIMRAGRMKEGVLGLLCWLIAGFIVIPLIWALAIFPAWAGMVVTVVFFLWTIWMWIRSFRPGRMTHRLWVVFAGVLALFVVASYLHLNRLIVRPFKVPSGAMAPTFIGEKNSESGVGDHVILDKFSYWFKLPQRGDIVAFGISGIPGLRRVCNVFLYRR